MRGPSTDALDALEGRIQAQFTDFLQPDGVLEVAERLAVGEAEADDLVASMPAVRRNLKLLAAQLDALDVEVAHYEAALLRCSTSDGSGVSPREADARRQQAAALRAKAAGVSASLEGFLAARAAWEQETLLKYETYRHVPPEHSVVARARRGGAALEDEESSSHAGPATRSPDASSVSSAVASSRLPTVASAAATSANASLRRTRDLMAEELARVRAVSALLEGDAASLRGVAAATDEYAASIAEGRDQTEAYKSRAARDARAIRLAFALLVLTAVYVTARRLLRFLGIVALP